jgi:hypothetical protein
MPRVKATPELIENIIARVPEGFIRYTTIEKRINLRNSRGKNAVSGALNEGKVARLGEFYYDPSRVTDAQVREYGAWCHPSFPTMDDQGVFHDAPVAERLQNRAQAVAPDSAEARILAALYPMPSYAPADQLTPNPGDDVVLAAMLKSGMLKRADKFIYDPLRLSDGTMQAVVRHHRLIPIHQNMLNYLATQPGKTASKNDLAGRFGGGDAGSMKDLLAMGGLVTFNVALTKSQISESWLRLEDADPAEAEKVVLAATRKVRAEERDAEDQKWQPLLEEAGDIIREGARDGQTCKTQVVARTYRLETAARFLNVSPRALDTALHAEKLPSFIDPEGRVRIPARDVQAAAADETLREEVTAYETLTAREISLVSDLSYSAVRRKLEKAGLSRTDPLWEQVRGQWGLPETLREFQEVLKPRMEAWRAEIIAQKEAEAAEARRRFEEQRRQEREKVELDRQRRRELRHRLMAAFPTWQHERRADQFVVLHVGPPNSGKTHDALNVLAEAGTGWYLAPLRLLAFEIFDRLNQRGVLCNLLTGEEYIPVPGARVTAATIEMFNPNDSGQCVIIDEAQMLADPDRGWAWTRALMEAQSPEIHVIGPPTVQALIEQMANAAGIPLGAIEHQRLAPIQIAEHPWTLDRLPPRTILVAFSRRMVLQLKTELERMRRTVSVVYGSLPPEVRRRQAERFASGQTEICVATDAVGMGLNLPADNVCFFEIEKFDGRQIRLLTPSEIQQIGGRAGRFGYSEAGEIGATNKRDLKMIRQLYYEEPQQLRYARVAPSVEDLDMIPGSLADKLAQWASLQSIPESLRDAIRTADMTERIELAKMLTDEEVRQLGMEAALRLVNAPARESTQLYWYNCTRAILSGKEMPLPPQAVIEINDNADLEAVENCVSCSDIYLWLANRKEFGSYGSRQAEVRTMRAEWSAAIDLALLKKLDTARRCAKCGAPLPLNHRYSICNNCYGKRINYRRDEDLEYSRRR